jgi:hypothetical protein
MRHWAALVLGGLLFLIGLLAAYIAIRLFIDAARGGSGDFDAGGTAGFGTAAAIVGLVFGIPGFILLSWWWRGRRPPSAV